MFDVILFLILAITIVAFIISIPCFAQIAEDRKYVTTCGRHELSQKEIEKMRRKLNKMSYPGCKED